MFGILSRVTNTNALLEIPSCRELATVEELLKLLHQTRALSCPSFPPSVPSFFFLSILLGLVVSSPGPPLSPARCPPQSGYAIFSPGASRIAARRRRPRHVRPLGARASSAVVVVGRGGGGRCVESLRARVQSPGKEGEPATSGRHRHRSEVGGRGEDGSRGPPAAAAAAAAAAAGS